MSINIMFEGKQELKAALKRKSEAKYDAASTKSLVEMFNRAHGNNPASGGTPVDTGQLRQSVTYSKVNREIGYTKEYASHIEYGHRTKGGSFVAGQKFLQKNVDIQKPIYRQDMLKILKGA